MRESTFRVRGHVQGVGFRWWTRSQALRLGVSGSVRNCPDGTVEVHARAPDEVLGRFRDLLAKGPPGARVEQVEEGEASGVPGDGFVIAR